MQICRRTGLHLERIGFQGTQEIKEFARRQEDICFLWSISRLILHEHAEEPYLQNL